MPFLLLIPVILLANGCTFPTERVSGSGVIKEEVRQVGQFNKVSFAGSSDIKIISGADRAACSIQWDDNLLSSISTEVVDNVLHVQLQDSSKISPTRGLQVEISVPDLTALELLGGTTTQVVGLKPGALVVNLSGSHNLQCEGQADNVHFTVAGANKINAAKLQSKSSSIDLSGSGSVELQATETLDVKIAGSGIVRSIGEPTIKQSISGRGKIEKME